MQELYKLFHVPFCCHPIWYHCTVTNHVLINILIWIKQKFWINILKCFTPIFSSSTWHGVQKLRATVFTQKGFKRYICDIAVMSGSFASITCSVFHVSCKCTYYHYAKYNCSRQNAKLNRSINYDHLRKKTIWVKHIFVTKCISASMIRDTFDDLNCGVVS